MTTDTRTPGEIERDIEINRDRLTANIDALQDRFSLDGLVRQVTDQLRENGGDIGRSLYDQVRANPLPLALTGIGLAWMIFGSPAEPPAARPVARTPDWRERPRPVSRPPVGQDTRPSWAQDALGEREAFDSGPVHGTGTTGPGTLSAAGSAVRETGVAAGDRVSAAGSAIAGGAGAVQREAAHLGSRIAEGTEALSAEARQRVIDARRKAMEWQRQGSRSLSSGVDATADFYDRQPLVMGALAFALGAAVASALPGTDTENSLMGQESDDLFHEAERIFAEERAKAERVVGAAVEEAGHVVDETRADLDARAPGDRTAAEAAADTAGSAASRVADAARDAARTEELGKPAV